MGRPTIYKHLSAVKQSLSFLRRAKAKQAKLDAATSERVKADVAAVLATRTADYWEETLGPKSVCVTAVQSLAAMLGSDHAGARGMVAETRHDVYGTECHLANPIALSLTPAAVRRAAPVPGEDDHTPSQALREDTAT